MAQVLVEQGYTTRFDYAFKELRELAATCGGITMPRTRYGSTGNKLHEAGLIKSIRQKSIDKHTNWRFLNELKRELKI